MKQLKIGIYKPGKEIFFNLNNPSYTYGGSEEIVNFSKILASHEHIIYLFSKSDYKNNIKNIYKCDKFFQLLEIIKEIDVLFIFNGIFEDYNLSENTFFKHKKYNNFKIVFVKSDLKLTSLNYNKYDFILTQQKDVLYKKEYYSHSEKLILYKNKINKNPYNKRKKEGIFVGNERDRVDKFKEYIIKGCIKSFGRSESLNLNNKVGRKIANKLLSTYLYSVVFSGDKQNKKGFISQRYFENCLRGIINFVDSDYDKDELIIKKNDFRKIKNINELHNKLMFLNNELFNILQQQQFKEIEPWLDGEKFYRNLIKILEKEL